jgi:hypothetical protein
MEGFSSMILKGRRASQDSAYSLNTTFSLFDQLFNKFKEIVDLITPFLLLMLFSCHHTLFVIQKVIEMRTNIQ